MRHPVRTLLYEIFVEPVTRLLQRVLGRHIEAPSPKTSVPPAA